MTMSGSIEYCSSNLKDRLRKTLRRRDRPSILMPDYLHLYTLARTMRELLAGQMGIVLDIGCGESPYRSFLTLDCTYIRLDIDSACRPDITADALTLPIRGDSVDLVLCTQVAEFVDDPEGLISECRRVLKPGGKVVLSAPFFWPNQPAEADNYRFSLGAMRRLFSAFSSLEVRANGNKWVTLAQVASSCVWNAIGVSGALYFFVTNLLGRLLDKLPADSYLTIDYAISAVKPH